jgi:CBS domain-containing protein
MYEFTRYQVRDVMTPDPMTAEGETTLGEIEDIFAEHDFNGLPVCDQESNCLGMVTKLDLLKAFDFSEKTKIPAYDVIRNYECSRFMSQKITTVRLETPLTRVLHTMIETGYKSFPVTEENKLRGVIAREDIIGALIRASRGLVPKRLEE